ncbi:MAG: hypothetical protein V5A87_08230, partial [Candidatus Bipolaricaulota bacterium]
MNKLQSLNKHSFRNVFGKVFVLVLLLALLVPTTGVHAADDEVKIGSLMAMSGALASYGPP